MFMASYTNFIKFCQTQSL